MNGNPQEADITEKRIGGEQRQPVLAVTVVSSNEDLLVPCLDSLLRYRPRDCDFRVYVAWNGPARGLAALPPSLVKRYPDVVMIESHTSGFPPNQNLLLSQITADYYLVINDDVVFLPGSVDKPLAYMERPEASRIGVLSIRLLNADGSLQPSTYSFAGLFRTVLSVSGLRSLVPLSPRLFRLAGLLGFGAGKSQYWSHTETVEIDSCRGAYLLVRHAALRQAGLWDVKGGEETEWHMRFRKCGWKIVFFHGAEVIHLGSGTVGKGSHAGKLINLRSFLNIYHKHEPAWRYSVIRGAFLISYLARYARAKIRRSPEELRAAVHGLKMIRRWPNEVEADTE